MLPRRGWLCLRWPTAHHAPRAARRPAARRAGPRGAVLRFNGAAAGRFNIYQSFECRRAIGSGPCAPVPPPPPRQEAARGIPRHGRAAARPGRRGGPERGGGAAADPAQGGRRPAGEGSGGAKARVQALSTAESGVGRVALGVMKARARDLAWSRPERLPAAAGRGGRRRRRRRRGRRQRPLYPLVQHRAHARAERVVDYPGARRVVAL